MEARRTSKRNLGKQPRSWSNNRRKSTPATPQRKSSSKEKVEFISDYRFEDGKLQFKVKWKEFPESSCDWKNREYFPVETLQNFLQDYKKKYLLYCTDKNHEKDLSRDDIGFEETFSKMSLFGIPKYKYKNEEKTFKFTSDYEINKFKTKIVLKKEKDKMNAALKPKCDFEIENEVDDKCFPNYIEWSKNYPGVQKFPKTTENDVSDIKRCECKNNCIIKPGEKKIKKSVECCLKPENSYKSDGRLRLVDRFYTLYECDSSCECDKEKCLNRVVQRGSDCELCLFRTLDRGWGVKTKKKIRKGTFISEYCGDIIGKDEYKKRLNKYENLGNKYFFTITDQKDKATGFTIDPTVSGNEARFFNHCCKPNMQYMGVNTDKNSKFSRLAFFAKRNINEEEELTWDYNGTFVQMMDCKCIICVNK